ncbi:TPA: hypothetical protein ACH3X3_010564 [Trebouxia sp. C0006]
MSTFVAAEFARFASAPFVRMRLSTLCQITSDRLTSAHIVTTLLRPRCSDLPFRMTAFRVHYAYITVSSQRGLQHRALSKGSLQERSPAQPAFDQNVPTFRSVLFLCQFRFTAVP